MRAAEKPIRLLALSGSLRIASSNTAAVTALRLLATPPLVVTIYDGLRAIPAFDPDLDGPEPPREVAGLRALIATSDALVISSPEYARGVAGALKNVLDWLVSGHEIPGKPVALINTSPRAIHAPAALRLTLETMSARIVEEACVTLPLLGRTLPPEAIAADPGLASLLRSCFAALTAAVNTTAGGEPPS